MKGFPPPPPFLMKRTDILHSNHTSNIFRWHLHYLQRWLCFRELRASGKKAWAWQKSQFEALWIFSQICYIFHVYSDISILYLNIYSREEIILKAKYTVISINWWLCQRRKNKKPCTRYIYYELKEISNCLLTNRYF